MIYSPLQDYQKYSRQMQIYSYIGCLIRSPRMPPFIHCIIVIIICFIQIFMCFAGINFFLSNAQDIATIGTSLALICTYLSTVLKVTRYLVKNKDIQEAGDTLKALFNLELKHESKRPILLSRLPLFRKICNMYVMTFVVCDFAYNIPPVIAFIYQHACHISPKKYQLTLAVKFLWPTPESGWRFFLHYVLQLCTCFTIYWINVGTEICFVFYVFHMGAVFDTMIYRLENPEEDESRALLLRACAKKHKLLMRCHDIIQDVYGPIIVTMVLSNGLAMCSLLFQTFQTHMTLKTAAIQLSYFIIKFVQINLYAWCSTLVTVKSETFANSVYFSDWVGKSKGMKSDLIITMIQRPLIVNASGFYNVSMDLIPKIMNTTVSYYLMMKTFSEN